jgi:hypothetical protein
VKGLTAGAIVDLVATTRSRCGDQVLGWKTAPVLVKEQRNRQTAHQRQRRRRKTWAPRPAAATTKNAYVEGSGMAVMVKELPPLSMMLLLI